jgi:elongator complex protein 3
MIKNSKQIFKDLIRARLRNQADLARSKRRISKKYGIPFPSNIELLKVYHKLAKNKTRLSAKDLKRLEILLKTRPIRSLSGIVNISILTKPYPCPGKCIFCPTEKGMPKSYLSGEPAVERARKLKFNPYLQVKKRIEMLELEGHPTDKIELRIVGGTWSYYPKKYQLWFVKRCFEACNGEAGQNLQAAQKSNEKAKHRIVGLSIETRPDFIDREEIRWLRNLGVTLVELGVQTIYDDVLNLNLRGHATKETISATRLLKDAGFKILYQMMPNLAGSDLRRDEKMFKGLFDNPDFRPDLLKIYPCALLKEASLYRLYKSGKYKPYNEKQLIRLLKTIKKRIPLYVRIQRISRDIPSPKIIAGAARISNLRQILAALMKKEDWKCRCIRCREIKEKYNPKEKILLLRQDYLASGAREIFLSFENRGRNKLYSLLRLRIPGYEKEHSQGIEPVLKNAAIIREIHTYGQVQSLQGLALPFSPQHKGLGKKLVRAAEKITKKEFNLNKIAVISGVGARDYFRGLGYRLKNTYMTKRI